MTTTQYPEHEKLQAHQSEAYTLSRFIGFLAEQGWEIAAFDDEGERLFPIHQRPDEIIDIFLEIDPKKLETEKVALLDQVRRANDKNKRKRAPKQ